MISPRQHHLRASPRAPTHTYVEHATLFSHVHKRAAHGAHELAAPQGGGVVHRQLDGRDVCGGCPRLVRIPCDALHTAEQHVTGRDSGGHTRQPGTAPSGRHARRVSSTLHGCTCLGARRRQKTQTRGAGAARQATAGTPPGLSGSARRPMRHPGLGIPAGRCRTPNPPQSTTSRRSSGLGPAPALSCRQQGSALPQLHQLHQLHQPRRLEGRHLTRPWHRPG